MACVETVFAAISRLNDSTALSAEGCKLTTAIPHGIADAVAVAARPRHTSEVGRRHTRFDLTRVALLAGAARSRALQ